MSKKLKLTSSAKQLSTERKIQLSDLITVKRNGNIALQRSDDENIWVVTLNHSQRTYTYKSSTWARNKYRRLLVVTGIIDENTPFDDDEEEDLCEKKY
jgi:hypothetical protein